MLYIVALGLIFISGMRFARSCMYSWKFVSLVCLSGFRRYIGVNDKCEGHNTENIYFDIKKEKTIKYLRPACFVSAFFDISLLRIYSTASQSEY